MTRRFGNSDKITEAKEVLTLIRGEFGSLQGSTALNWGTPTIGTIEPDDSEEAGTSTNPARSDHQHAIVASPPGADSVNLAASAEGSAASFARSDHTHNLDESITPTWTGATHTFDDGSGDSPAIQLVGGSNNDTVKIYLDDDATAADSDLVIQLCDAVGDSGLIIHDSSPAAVLKLDSDGNVEMQSDGSWIGRGPASARTVYNASGNAVKLYSSADLELYSDAGSTKVGTWDGATGNIQLDDGSGDSPELQFIGGTNDDTIKIFLDDWAAAAGGSDLNVQLADAAGNSNFEIWDSSPAAVLKLDSDGNIELITDGAWIGFASSGPKMTFDNSNDFLEITNCRVVVGTTAAGATLHAEQSSATGSIPVLFLEQKDTDEDFIYFDGTANQSDNTYSLVDNGDFVEGSLIGWFKIYVNDTASRITTGSYYVPFYTTTGV